MSIKSTWTPIQPPKPSNKPLSTTPDSRPTPIRVLTYNVWFDNMFQEQRTRDLLRIIQEENPDVLCFQEVTMKFQRIMHKDPYWKENWTMTKFEDQSVMVGESWYGTAIAVKKALHKSFVCKAFLVKFKGTQTGRCLTVVELKPRTFVAQPILVSTVHLDYTPELRKRHFRIAIDTLSGSSPDKPIPSFICGDTNIDSYNEIQPLLDAGFVDSWIATHPPTPVAPATSPFSDPTSGATATPPPEYSPDLIHVDPTYGQTGVHLPGKPKKENVRRLDYLMCRNMNVKTAKLVGTEPIDKDKVNLSFGNEEQKALEGVKVWPSDHVGVLVDLEVVWNGIGAEDTVSAESQSLI
ncbi:hypothetical protein M407DRAFT_86159 [Tulasnella calospora MUT 4182]|uniref:Endonuclease/exonuclease/phosphatase domain-containing protein n=1 Tax=Tulasnella calospora MUT 4182 TaxID=1051891 RepID=A0A0C3L3M6_9AGAM|nr:hypothetical protein M407DRAFT_86159 [Tulasnella calospora MUT 4182]